MTKKNKNTLICHDQDELSLSENIRDLQLTHRQLDINIKKAENVGSHTQVDISEAKREKLSLRRRIESLGGKTCKFKRKQLRAVA